MKSRYVVLSACISSLLIFSHASVAAENADAAWTELETLMRGPKERPKSQEEAKAMLKTYLAQLDEKAAAFRKDYPTDPRRWRLHLQEVQTNQMRELSGLPKRSDEEIAKLTAEVLAAPDADAKTKGAASFYRAAGKEDDEAEFKRLAEAHLKEFPDFPGNPQLTALLKGKEAERELKTKPLDLKFTATDGSAIDLASMRGKVVLIDFWATWCGPCVAEVPKIVGAYEKLHGKGFEILGISFDQDKAALEKFVKDKKMPWPQYFDGKGGENPFAQRFGINSIPRMWLVDKKGMIADLNAREDLEAKVEKLLAQ